ncbi:hypothetical protein YTPLAS72_09200 [Nitrospira sp.]|nr:hypothetical protein YTPLAS72_09200 [Nitrospira sp.]
MDKKMRRDVAQTNSIDQVRNALEQLDTDCALNEVVDFCPELTWCQVFLAIDHLSRQGYVQVLLEVGGTYRVRTYRSV